MISFWSLHNDRIKRGRDAIITHIFKFGNIKENVNYARKRTKQTHPKVCKSLLNHYIQVEVSTLEIIGYGIKDMSISTLEA